MKPKTSPLRALLLLLGSSALTLSSSHAQLQWDANGTGTGQTDGGGTWLNLDQWWDGVANQTWVTGSDAIIGNAGTGGAITVGAVSAGTVLLDNFTGTYTLQGTGTILTQSGGITIGESAGNVTFRGTGDKTNVFTLSGAGGLTKSGSGLLSLRENLVMNYTGATVINGGTVQLGGSKAVGNWTVNNAMLTDYYRATTSFVGISGVGVGTGDNQIQISGNSGFGGGNGNSTWRIGTAGSTLVWGALGDGSATGFFNPTTLRFLSSVDNMGPSIYGQVTLDNGLDLNGAGRTISVLGATGNTALASSSATIARNIIATGGGSLIKNGAGNLVLSGANSYDGGTEINNGMIRFGTRSSMPATGAVSVADGATLGVTVASSGTTWGGGIGNAGIAGLTAGLGGQAGSTVSFLGNSNLLLNVTGTTTESNAITNGGATNLALIKIGGSTLTLSGDNSYTGKTRVYVGTLSFNSIGNVGSGNSALGAPATTDNATLDVDSAATLHYTGTGHTSDRVINLAGAGGIATLDASGTGPLILTSSLSAVAGAKTLALTGNNTDANTLGTTSIPGLAEVLTIQKGGAGTWRINGFSSPKNAWSVTAGTLLVAGQITTGDQNVTVSGGTLAGVGPITLQSNRSLTVQAAGSLSPGNSGVGTMAVTGILNIAAMAGGTTGKLIYEMAAPAASDRIAVTGTAQIGTGLLGLNDFVFTALDGMTANTYVLISTTGGITGTLDPANRIGTIGTISGALQINGNNLEFTIDSDLDGMPDSYELANTNPPSPIALDPDGDALLDNDGLTNLQEYLIGTNPNNPDTDADGLLDGVETRTGTWVSATNTGTNPLVFDTDGDGIRDGYETNTTIFASATNTGTNPHKRDTDSDGLADNIETGTGAFVSNTNTGTNPNNPDSDGDGAGDWYEIAIIDAKPGTQGYPPNNPNNPAVKPNIPYPLPDPDASTGATDKPVKVYIMSGQSNMVGFGQIEGSGPGTLQTMTGAENKFPNLVASGGGWTTRNDVKYRGVITDIAPPGNANLKPDVAGDKYGPELGFGYVIGWYHDEPVLLIKASEGNRGLMWDLLPPGSPRTVSGATTYPSYGESPETWATTGGGPSPFVWYAGKQYDDFFLKESDMGPAPWATAIAYPASCQVRRNGVTYISKTAHTSGPASEPGVGVNFTTYWDVYSVFNTADVLDNFAAEYPAWAAQGFEIAGFVWWQGYDDTGEPRATRYEPNMVQFIKQVRSYYENRYNNDNSALTKTKANAPFVLATLATNGGWSNPDAGHLKVANAQLAVDGAAKNALGILNYPEFAGNVKTVEARGFWRDSSVSPNGQGYHYNWNAETYLLVGDALGRAMVSLESSAVGNTFADWMATFPSVPPALAGFSQDADGDGIENGAENFFGTNPGIGSTGMVAGASSGNTFTFTHPKNATPATGVTGIYRWSKDLATFHNGGQTDGDDTTVSFNAVTTAGITTVTATITGTATSRLFVDVKVTQN